MKKNPILAASIITSISLIAGISCARKNTDPGTPFNSNLPLSMASETLPSSPGDGIVIPANRPAQALAQYSGSEAEAYQGLLDRRRGSLNWLDQVQLLGESISIETFSHDGMESYIPGYTIYDPAIAAQVRTRLNLPQFQSGQQLREETVRSLSDSNFITFAVGQPLLDHSGRPVRDSQGRALVKVEYDRHAFPGPGIEQRPITPEQSRYLDFIRDVIQTRLAELNQSAGGYYQNPDYGTSEMEGAHIHNSFGQDRYHGIIFDKIMEAIRTHDERSLMIHVVNFATIYHQSRTEPKSAFIDAYTFLFVAKKFPTLAARQRYLHFTLRCGGIQ